MESFEIERNKFRNLPFYQNIIDWQNSSETFNNIDYLPINPNIYFYYQNEYKKICCPLFLFTYLNPNTELYRKQNNEYIKIPTIAKHFGIISFWFPDQCPLGSNSVMSYGHFYCSLNKKIINVFTLKNENIDEINMMKIESFKFFKNNFKKIISHHFAKSYYISHDSGVINENNKLCRFMESIKSIYSLRIWDNEIELKNVIENNSNWSEFTNELFEEKYFKYCFHLTPSIGNLHMHIIYLPLITNKFKSKIDEMIDIHDLFNFLK